MRCFLVFACLLSACASVPETELRQPTEWSELQGQYRVERFARYRPSLERGEAYVNFGQDNTVGLRMECNYTAAPIKLVAPGLLEPDPTPRDYDFIVTTMGCPKQRGHGDSAFFSLFDEPLSVGIRPDGRVVLQGDRKVVLLPEADARQLNAPASLREISGDWRVLSVTDLSGGTLGGYWDRDHAVEISDGALSYAGCPQRAGRMSVEDGRLVSDDTGGLLAAVCGADERFHIAVNQVLRRDLRLEWMDEGDTLVAYDDEGRELKLVRRWPRG